MRGLKVFLLLIIPFWVTLYGQASDELAKVGTAGAQFLKFPVGARGASLGNGLITKVHDASAAFWNPAGLATMDRISAVYSHSTFFLDMSFDGASVVYSLPQIGSIGLNFVTFSSGDIEETTVDQQYGTGNTFRFTDLALGVSVARALTDRFSIGGNLRYIHEDLASGLGSGSEFKASNWSVDIGILYFTDFMGLTVGMYIKNFGPQLQPAGTYQDWDNGTPVMDPSNPTKILDNEYKKYHMPLTFQLGLGLEPFQTGPHQLTLFSVLEHPNDNVEVLNLAGEYHLSVSGTGLFLRSGYSLGHDIKGLTFGGGIEFRDFQLDYALVDYGLLEFVNILSITYNK